MNSKKIYELLDKVQNNTPILPVGVTSHRTLLPSGKWCYIFRHIELGQLGRILILPHSSGQSQIMSEVSGDEDDPMTLKRREIFEPIVEDTMQKMDKIFGDGIGVIEPYESPKDEQSVKSMLYPCEICKKAVALVVFADGAVTAGSLEDYARMMHSKIKELNIPTWIVGEESEYIVNGEDLRKSLVLTIHRNREINVKTPDEIMDAVDELMEIHCSRQNN